MPNERPLCQMKRIVLAFALLVVMASSNTAMAEWYKGGTLHRASASQWNAAAPKDRLATAGDWSAAILGEDRVRRMGLSGLKVVAQSLADCVSEAVADGPNNLAVSEVAAMCLILMGVRN